ncbi:unnamed protein product [Natator depressus]
MHRESQWKRGRTWKATNKGAVIICSNSTINGLSWPVQNEGWAESGPGASPISNAGEERETVSSSERQIHPPRTSNDFLAPGRGVRSDSYSDHGMGDGRDSPG